MEFFRIQQRFVARDLAPDCASAPSRWPAAVLGLCLALCATTGSANGQVYGPPKPPFVMWSDNNQTPLPGEEPKAGDPVILSTGNLHVEETDLTIAGRGMDFTFTRTYRSGSAVSSALGHRWDFNWNQFIALQYDTVGGGGGGGDSGEGDDQDPIIQGAFYYNGQTRIDWFTPSGGLMWNTPAGTFAKLRHEGGLPLPDVTPTAFKLRSADGKIFTFGFYDNADPSVYGLVYRLTRIEDRMGNYFELVYEDVIPNALRRINYVRDTLGRIIDFHYTAAGFLEYIEDFNQRRVTFTQDSLYNLTDVTSPSVTGTVTNNDFASGRTIHYDYSVGSANPFEHHNLTAMYDALEWARPPNDRTPYLTNTYEWNSPRVLRQDLGGVGASGVPSGGRFCFLYENNVNSHFWFTETARTMVIDPNGNTSLHLFDMHGNERLEYRFTGRFDPLNPPGAINALLDPSAPDPQTNTISGISTPLRPTDPKSCGV